MGEAERDELVSFLQDNKVHFRQLHHEPVFTSEQAARARGGRLDAGVKAMLFRGEGGESVMVLIRADRRVDLRKLEDATRIRHIRLARTRELRKSTGCEPGSVHPFGNLWGVRVVMDSGFDTEQVEFNAGTNTDSIIMSFADLFRLIQPTMCAIAQ